MVDDLTLSEDYAARLRKSRGLFADLPDELILKVMSWTPRRSQKSLAYGIPSLRHIILQHEYGALRTVTLQPGVDIDEDWPALSPLYVDKTYSDMIICGVDLQELYLNAGVCARRVRKFLFSAASFCQYLKKLVFSDNGAINADMARTVFGSLRMLRILVINKPSQNVLSQFALVATGCEQIVLACVLPGVMDAVLLAIKDLLRNKARNGRVSFTIRVNELCFNCDRSVLCIQRFLKHLGHPLHFKDACNGYLKSLSLVRCTGPIEEEYPLSHEWEELKENAVSNDPMKLFPPALVVNIITSTKIWSRRSTMVSPLSPRVRVGTEKTPQYAEDTVTHYSTVQQPEPHIDAVTRAQSNVSGGVRYRSTLRKVINAYSSVENSCAFDLKNISELAITNHCIYSYLWELGSEARLALEHKIVNDSCTLSQLRIISGKSTHGIYGQKDVYIFATRLLQRIPTIRTVVVSSSIISSIREVETQNLLSSLANISQFCLFKQKDERIDELTDVTIARSLPLFLQYVSASCRALKCIYLSDAHYTIPDDRNHYLSRPNLENAVHSINEFESKHPHVDVSTLRIQISAFQLLKAVTLNNEAVEETCPFSRCFLV